MSSLKDNNNPLKTKLKDMKFCNITNKELRIAILRKLNKLQEKTGQQLNKIRKKKKTQEQNEKLNNNKNCNREHLQQNKPSRR